MQEIAGEKAFPIYKYSAEWIENDATGATFKNGTQKYVMLKEVLGDNDSKLLENQYTNFLMKDGINRRDFKVTLKFVEFETWLITWFQHQRFDLDEKDVDLVRSFENYVQRQIKAGKLDQLMGADERHRWHSGSKVYKHLPCRCEHCKAEGVVRIAH